MATVFTHAFVAVAAGKTCYARPMPWKFWLLGAGCSALPDLDTGLLAYGVHYEDLCGHRGLSHSLAFAMFVAVVVSTWLFRPREWPGKSEEDADRRFDAPLFTRRWWGLVLFFFAVTASHGVIDAFTNGGLGIAFFSPFDTTRYFFPWNPIEVSFIGAAPLFTREGLRILTSEFVWVWLPATIIMLAAIGARRVFRRRPAHSS